MANYFYVKSGGTAVGASVDAADGVYSSKQTGTWSGTASEYYPNLGAASSGTVVPTAGDYILVSDVHSASYALGAIAVFDSSTTNAKGIHIISVDDTDREAYKPGASETNTNSFNWRFVTNILVAGVSFTGDQASILEITNYANIILKDVTITAGTTFGDDWLKIENDGTNMSMINVELIGRHNSNAIRIGNGTRLKWCGGSVTGGQTHNDFLTLAGNGGAFIDITGVDLSPVSILCGSMAEVDDNVEIKLKSCKLRVAVTIPTPYDDGQIFEMYNCDDATGNDFHRFLRTTGSGAVYNNDSVYVTATKAWYGGLAYSSMEVTTTAFCNHGNPFVFDFPSRYADLSDASSDLVTIELVTAAAQTLTDTDIAAFLVYPDGTTAVIPVWVTSGKTVGAGNYGVDPLAAGTTLAAGALGAGDWTGEPVSGNFYKMQLDTTGTAGQATALAIRIEVYKPSIAVGELFIHPLVTLS